jgi:hypothetical protein
VAGKIIEEVLVDFENPTIVMPIKDNGIKQANMDITLLCRLTRTDLEIGRALIGNNLKAISGKVMEDINNQEIGAEIRLDNGIKEANGTRAEKVADISVYSNFPELFSIVYLMVNLLSFYVYHKYYRFNVTLKMKYE